MKPFFQLQSLAEVHRRCAEAEPLPTETIALDELWGRTLAAEVHAPEDLPGFSRSTMDGYAVIAADTFGSSESSPAYLERVAEVMMGDDPAGLSLQRGQCAQIATGGMLPPGADAVVMVEHTRTTGEDAAMIEIAKPLAPGANVIGPTDDAERGQLLLPAGHRLRPQDLGLLAAFGLTEAAVVRRPRIGIISSGDEIVPIETQPRPGQVRDVNAHTLVALARQAGAHPEVVGLVQDERAQLQTVVEHSLADNDLTLLSGGSSVGSRDHTAEVFSSFAGAELLVHGVTVAPGKPYIWVQVGEKQLLGLPGHVASCVIAFHLFVEPLIERLLGREARSFVNFEQREVTLTRGVVAASGRETYQRVRVWRDENQRRWLAEPQFGKSGLLRTLVQSHGLVRIPLGHEGFAADTTVTALLFPSTAR